MLYINNPAFIGFEETFNYWSVQFFSIYHWGGGGSGGAMVLGKLPVPGRPASLDKSRARAYCSCSRCGLGLFGHFYSHLSFLCLYETTRYRLKYCLKGSLSPKTTNQPTNHLSLVSIWVVHVPERTETTYLPNWTGLCRPCIAAVAAYIMHLVSSYMLKPLGAIL